jgi:hypothetical protein
MSLFDQPAFQQYVSSAYSAIQGVQEAAGIRLTPFAEQIITTWIVAPAFEDDLLVARFVEPNPAGIAFGSEVIGRLPDLLLNISATSGAEARSAQRRNVITSADLFHWLTERGRTELASLRWPYPKD